MQKIVDAGLNAVDTADSYSRWVPGNKGGESETIIGKWMKSRGNRDKVVVITGASSESIARRGGQAERASYDSVSSLFSSARDAWRI